MAKTIEEINAEMDAAYQDAYRLDGSELSDASEWKIWRGLFAQIIWIVYSFFDLFKVEVSELAATTEYGNNAWWHKILLEFQEGYSVSVIDGKVTYAIIDETAKIIKRASASEAFNGVQNYEQLKVARLVSGVPAPLSPAQLVMLESYIKSRKPAGVETQIISINADTVKSTETIYYDGKLDLNTFKSAMLIARTTYLSSIVFDGQFNLNDYRVKLKQVPGCIDADILTVLIKPEGGDFLPVTRVYNPKSGYYILDEALSVFNYVAV